MKEAAIMAPLRFRFNSKKKSEMKFFFYFDRFHSPSSGGCKFARKESECLFTEHYYNYPPTPDQVLGSKHINTY